MALPTTLSNTVIKGNQVSASGSYEYDGDLSVTSGSAAITENRFAGVASSGSTNRVSLSSAFATIQNNVFERNSADINSFIFNSGSVEQVITNNVFDSSVVAGTDDELAKGLASTSKLTDNTNQVSYAVISLTDKLIANNNPPRTFPPVTIGTVSSSPNPATPASVNAAIPPVLLTAGYTDGISVNNFISLAYSAGFSLHYFVVDLNNCLPKNTVVQDLKIGISGANSAPTSGQISLILGSQESSMTSSSYAAGSGILSTLVGLGVYDEVSTSSPYNVASNFASLLATTQYLSIAPTDSSFFINDGKHAMQFAISVSLNVGSSTTLNFSPLVVKYKYL